MSNYLFLSMFNKCLSLEVTDILAERHLPSDQTDNIHNQQQDHQISATCSYYLVPTDYFARFLCL